MKRIVRREAVILLASFIGFAAAVQFLPGDIRGHRASFFFLIWGIIWTSFYAVYLIRFVRQKLNPSKTDSNA